MPPERRRFRERYASHVVADVIDGLKTRLRPATESDLDLLVGWFLQPEVYRWWGGAPLERETVAEKYVGRRRPGVESLIIERADEPVGYAQFHQGFEDYHHEGEGGIDMFILPNFRRCGLGRDAIIALVDHFLFECGWTRVTVDPAKNNPRALSFWRACGFEYETDIESAEPAELLSRRSVGRSA
jgi:aminoglycoside 6'-N-acetyltransferase